MSLTRVYEEDSWSMIEDGKTLLTVKETEENGQILVKVSGTLKSEMEHAFKDELVALITVGMDVIVDCEQLQYIANACQEALLAVQQTADSINRGSLTLCHVPPAILEDFRRTNLHELLMIE